MSVGLSPARVVATRTDQMEWAGACAAILTGKRVTREAWASDEVCIFLRAGIVHLRKADGSLHTLIVSEGDLSATDWVVVRQQ